MIVGFNSTRCFISCFNNNIAVTTNTRLATLCTNQARPEIEQWSNTKLTLKFSNQMMFHKGHSSIDFNIVIRVGDFLEEHA